MFGAASARSIGDRLSRFMDGLGVQVPDELSETADLFELLHLAATISKDTADKTDAEFRQLEAEAVLTAPPGGRVQGDHARGPRARTRPSLRDAYGTLDPATATS